MGGILEIAPGNIIHYFIFPLNVVPLRIKVADFCLDFLPLTEGIAKPDIGSSTDLESTRKSRGASQLLQGKLFTYLTALLKPKLPVRCL